MWVLGGACEHVGTGYGWSMSMWVLGGACEHVGTGWSI